MYVYWEILKLIAIDYLSKELSGDFPVRKLEVTHCRYNDESKTIYFRYDYILSNVNGLHRFITVGRVITVSQFDQFKRDKKINDILQ